MRTIKSLSKAVYEPIADLVTYRAIPTRTISMNLLDPFIFLNHHGRQVYGPHNNGLPFGPHPHRGFETVTFILEGDLMHQDSNGASSTIREGGVQWMTTGSGLIHTEVSSDDFKAMGGPLEILQLWINLPAKYKMTAPKYTGLQKEEIPVLEADDGKISVQIISGNWQGMEGPVKPLTDIHLSCIHFKKGGQTEFNVPNEHNIFLYVVKGTINCNGKDIGMHHLAIFEHDSEMVQMVAKTDAIILFGHAAPFNEPFVAYGPFVMNTREEIMQAYDDYNKGKFGEIPNP
jgi:hypothetical protein